MLCRSTLQCDARGADERNVERILNYVATSSLILRKYVLPIPTINSITIDHPTSVWSLTSLLILPYWVS
jgi:hypothetical protein